MVKTDIKAALTVTRYDLSVLIRHRIVNLFLFYFLLHIYLYWKTFSYIAGFRYPLVS